MYDAIKQDGYQMESNTLMVYNKWNSEEVKPRSESTFVQMYGN